MPGEGRDAGNATRNLVLTVFGCLSFILLFIIVLALIFTALYVFHVQIHIQQ